MSTMMSTMTRVSTLMTGFVLSAALLVAMPTYAGATTNAQANTATTTAKTTKTTPPPSHTFADLAESLIPSVVNISSTQKLVKSQVMPDMPQFPPGSPFENFFEEFLNRHGEAFPAIPPASLGSGFIINAEKGYIVTNNHVVKDAEEVRVTFHDDTTLDAEIVGRDEKMDLAVLQVKTKKKLVAVEFGNSDTLRVGDWVLAIGNPFGLGGTVTAGIISAQQRNINAGPYDDFIQTDASINRGNSGGPMFDLNGHVIGINTAIYSPSGGSVGIGFAIPANLAKPVINQLVEYGRTRRGWIGVRIQNVTTEIAESLGLDAARGALVASITPTGPAEKAGLKPGDVILEFDGKTVTSMRNLPRLVAETALERKVPLSYWREGKTYKTTIVVGELEKAEQDGLITLNANQPSPAQQQPDSETIDTVGLTIGPIMAQDREQYKISDDVTGVIIREVERESEASEKGLIPGDVIVEVNQKSVSANEDVQTQIATAEKEGKASVLLLVHREGDVRFVALRLQKN